MPLVEYIGSKERKTDNVASTGTVWYGAGDVKEVTPEAWGKLSAFPDVWRVYVQQNGLPQQSAEEAQAAAQDAKDKKVLLAEAQKLGCEGLDGRSGIKKIVDAIEAKKAELAASAGQGEQSAGDVGEHTQG